MALRSNSKIDLLRRVPLFEHCSKKDLALIAGVADELDLPAGSVLIQEGDRGREFLVIVSGDVEVRRNGRKRERSAQATSSARWRCSRSNPARRR